MLGLCLPLGFCLTVPGFVWVALSLQANPYPRRLIAGPLMLLGAGGRLFHLNLSSSCGSWWVRWRVAGDPWPLLALSMPEN